MHTIKKALDGILYWVSVLLFALLVIIVVWQIFTRQVLRDPSTWTEEGARQTFVWLGLFASAFLFGERGHIAVEYVARKVPVGGERVLAIIVQCIVLAFAVIVLVWGGWRASQNAWLQDLSALPFTLGQMYLALPVSGVLMAFYSVYYIAGMATSEIPPYADHSDGDDPELQLDKYQTSESLVLPDADDPDVAGSPPDGPGRRPTTDPTKEA